MRRCWYVPFPDKDGAFCDTGNARRSGFSSLTWRTVQPAGDSSFSQQNDSSRNPLNGVTPPKTILLLSLRTRLNPFLSFHGVVAPSHLQKKWSCFSLRVRLHLFLSFHNAATPSHLQKKWSCSFLRVRLHLFLHFHGTTAHSHLQKKWSCSSLRVRLYLFLPFHGTAAPCTPLPTEKSTLFISLFSFFSLGATVDPLNDPLSSFSG